MRSSAPSSCFTPTGIGLLGIGSVAAATNVPLAESKSSTHQRVPSVVSWVWRRLTPESGSQSIWGWMLRLCEIRPTKIDFSRNGRTTGSPGEGIGSGLCWASYHAGSIQTSATQSKVDAAWAATPAGGDTAVWVGGE